MPPAGWYAFASAVFRRLNGGMANASGAHCRDWKQKLKRLGVLTFLVSIGLAGLAVGQTPDSRAGVPHLEKRGGATQLVVDGKPFLVLGESCITRVPPASSI